MLTENLVKLNEKVQDKHQAIQLAGELLLQNNDIQKEYIDSMHQRDEKLSVYMGNMIAIPHGTDEGRKYVLNTSISVIQVPNGVDFNGNEVKMVFGIAAKEEEHMEIISNLAILCSDEENVKKLVSITNKEEMIEIIKRGEI